MKTVDPGHVFELAWLDGTPNPFLERGGHGEPLLEIGRPDRLIFVKREGDKYPGNVGHHPGTTMQEVLRALCARIKYVDAQKPYSMNAEVLSHFRGAIFFLEYRAAVMHDRLGDFLARFGNEDAIELVPTCPACGHIWCDGSRHGNR